MEIERKFLVPANFRQLLEENGFGLVREFEEVLQDKYFDTQDHHLLHMVPQFRVPVFEPFCFSVF